jgi:hypothetical protein
MNKCYLHGYSDVWMRRRVIDLVWVSVCVSLFCFCTPRDDKPQPTSIAALKAQDPEKMDRAAFDKVKIVEGYFINETVPLLISDPKLLEINRPLPDSSFILLSGAGVEQLIKQKDSYGSYIRIRGRVAVEHSRDTGRPELSFSFTQMPEIIRKSQWSKPVVYDICKQYPAICEIIRKLPKKCALLYSGGYNASNAHLRYWNDLKFMYLTLRNKYGYTDANIVVVYKNGVAEDGDMTVDYAASPSGLNDAVTYLQGRLTGLSTFFLFVTNHGGGYHTAHARNEGGRADGAGGDEIDAYKYDEATYYYGQTVNDVWDDDFASKINSLRFLSMTAVLEPCFSGGLLYDLRGSRRILISAASEFEYSWSGAPGNHDIFSYHITCALNQADHTGAALSPNPDSNGDGKTSMLEAFLYAKSKDTASETPFLEDSGDGIGTNSPTASGPDGVLANSTKL